jgi:hypothetical protein
MEQTNIKVLETHRGFEQNSEVVLELENKGTQPALVKVLSDAPARHGPSSLR